MTDDLLISNYVLMDVPDLRSTMTTFSRVSCLPSSSKFDGCSHARNAESIAGHSVSIIEYHAVSRERPL